MTDTLRVYVACLASYNAGKLHGRWIDVEADGIDDLQAEIEAMLAASPEALAEEWAIHDWEAPVAFGIGEHESLDDLVAYAALLEDFDHDVLSAAAELWSSSEGVDALRTLVDQFRGSFETAGEYAEETFGDVYQIPDAIAPYVDWSALERDMELSGDISTVRSGGRLYVFDNHD